MTRQTLFGLTHQEHLQEASDWLTQNRQRLHAPDCTVHQPSAQCSCGLHRTLTNINAVLDDLKGTTE